MTERICFAWSPLDYLTSRVRSRSIATNDPTLRLVYLELLNWLQHEEVGLQDDESYLADLIGVQPAEVRRCIQILLDLGRSGRGGLFGRDGLLFNRRVSDEIAKREAFSAAQSQHGKRGALLRGKKEAEALLVDVSRVVSTRHSERLALAAAPVSSEAGK